MEVTVEEVVKAIERYKCPSKCVVITGGEPMIQENDVYELAKILTGKGLPHCIGNKWDEKCQHSVV